jgi:hypothetical protein
VVPLDENFTLYLAVCEWQAWKVEERRESDQRLMAVWYLVEGSPYMVAGEVFLPNGQVQKMTEIALP